MGDPGLAALMAMGNEFLGDRLQSQGLTLQYSPLSNLPLLTRQKSTDFHGGRRQADPLCPFLSCVFLLPLPSTAPLTYPQGRLLCTSAEGLRNCISAAQGEPIGQRGAGGLAQAFACGTDYAWFPLLHGTG